MSKNDTAASSSTLHFGGYNGTPVTANTWEWVDGNQNLTISTE